MDFEQQMYKISNCIHKMMRIQLFINDKASSSTLVEGLARHDHKRHYNIKWIHEKAKLTITKRSQRPKHDKSRVFALYGASQRRIYKRKWLIYTKKTRVFRVLTSHLECARSRVLRLIAAPMCSIVQPGELSCSYVLNFHPLAAFLCQWPATHLRHQKLTENIIIMTQLRA